METPSLFSALSTLTVFFYKGVEFIKTSQATDAQEGRAMRIIDGRPWKFDQRTEVIPTTT